jgi:predicted CopG family antitoxin
MISFIDYTKRFLQQKFSDLRYLSIIQGSVSSEEARQLQAEIDKMKVSEDFVQYFPCGMLRRRLR